MEKTNNKNKVEKLLWSIALPGFGQILNGKYLKGVLLIALEILVNVQANFNLAIIYSFHGEIKQYLKGINQKEFNRLFTKLWVGCRETHKGWVVP